MILTIICTALVVILSMFLFNKFIKPQDPRGKKPLAIERKLLDPLAQDNMEEFKRAYFAEKFSPNYVTVVGYIKYSSTRAFCSCVCRISIMACHICSF